VQCSPVVKSLKRRFDFIGSAIVAGENFSDSVDVISAILGSHHADIVPVFLLPGIPLDYFAGSGDNGA
jgi:hypothetical protein